MATSVTTTESEIGTSSESKKHTACKGKCLVPGRLDGQIVVVTGANTGIGLETVGELARRGALIIMAGRSLDRLEAGRKELLSRYSAQTGDRGLKLNVADDTLKSYLTHVTTDQLVLEQLDLASLASVRDFAQRFLANYNKLNVLVNNAGVMACPYSETVDGFEQQIGVNHIGHFHLTNLLLPALQYAAAAKENARVVTLSSKVHTMGKLNLPDINTRGKDYSPFPAYFQSKLANVLFAKELASRTKDSGILSVSLHPGVVHTELSRQMNAVIRCFYNGISYVVAKTPWSGAQTTLYCVLANDIETGAYYADCRIKEASAAANDTNLARQLWEITERLIVEAETKH